MDQAKIYDSQIGSVILENHRNLGATTQHTCRLCLNRFAEGEQFWNVFDSDLPQKLMAFAAVELQRNDDLPTYICTNCRNLVYTCYNFKCQVEKSDHDLHQALIISTADLQWQTAVEVMAPSLQKDIINSCATAVQDFDTNNPEQFIFEIASSCDVGSDAFSSKDAVQTVDSLVRSMENNNLAVFQVDGLIAENSIGHQDLTITFQDGNQLSNVISLPLNFEPSNQNNINIPPELHNLNVGFPQQTSKMDDSQKSINCDGVQESSPKENVQENPNHSEDERPLILRTKRHKCNYCIKSFANLVLLQKHFEVHEKQVEIVYICYLCDKQFTSTDEMKDHATKMHDMHMNDEKILENVIMKNKNNCVQEIANGQKSNILTENNQIEGSNSEVQKKNNSQHNSKALDATYPCKPCKVVLRNTENLKSDENITSKLRSIKIFPLKNLRNRDVPAANDSSKSEKISCNNEGGQNSLNNHRELDNESDEDSEQNENDDKLQKNIQCSQCGSLFSTMRKLKKHLLIHSGNKYKCSKCDKDFYKIEKLRKHQDLKHNENVKVVKKRRKKVWRKRPYQCKLCPKAYATPQSLENHEHRHRRANDGTKRYLCEICSKTFAQSGSLIGHMRTHTGIRPYVCNVCSRGFTKRTYLQLHLRMHSGEKPHVCQYCNKAFARPNTLTRHLTVHTGEAKYQCETCKKHFRRLTSLNEHMYTHTGQKPYSCKYCFKSYNNAGSLYAHKKKCRTRHTNAKDIESTELVENSDSLSCPVSLPTSDDNTLEFVNELGTDPQVLIYSDKNMSDAMINDAIMSDSAICQFMINIDGDRVPTTPNIIEAFAFQDGDFYKPCKTPYYELYPII